MNDPMDQRTNASIHQSIQAFAAQLWEELFAKHGEPPLVKLEAEEDQLMLHADASYSTPSSAFGTGASGRGRGTPPVHDSSSRNNHSSNAGVDNGRSNYDDGSGGGVSQRRIAGQRLWQRLLRPGGSTDPHELLRDTLDGKEPELTSFFDAMVK